MTVAEAGERLDRYLAARYPHLTRNRLKKIIQQGGACVNARVARPARLLKAGDVVVVCFPQEPCPEVPAPEEIAFEVVYEDDDLLVVNKPAGLVVHPAGTVRAGTLVNGLLNRGGPLSSVGGPSRPGIVHRLDKGTSGLMLVAKRDMIHETLAQDIKERRVRREYWALVWGRPVFASGSFEGRLGRDERRRTRMAVLATGGRAACTHYRVERHHGWASELGLRLETGRTHQIRVHLADAGNPVFGDDTYGGRRCPSGVRGRDRRLARALLKELRRPALHAIGLTFRHPSRHDEMSFSAALPPDLSGVVTSLEGGAQT